MCSFDTLFLENRSFKKRKHNVFTKTLDKKQTITKR